MLDTADLIAKGFRPYRKTSLTFARQMDSAFGVQLDTGDKIYGKRGDYACVSPDDGGRWIVDRKIFETTYDLQPVARSTFRRGTVHSRLYRQGFRPYRKHQITWAKKLNKAIVVRTIEGKVRAHPGDYLCIGPSGDQWPQPAARFEAHYEQVAVNQSG
jgi:hypothetical protein